MRISGITLPDNKRMEIALTAVYGVGRSLAHKVLDEAKIEYGRKPTDLSEKEETDVRNIVEALKIEGDLKREKANNIKRLIDTGSYRGTRHAKRLPSRGQNTKTNSRTIRGNKRSSMGSGKVKVTKK